MLYVIFVFEYHSESSHNKPMEVNLSVCTLGQVVFFMSGLYPLCVRMNFRGAGPLLAKVRYSHIINTDASSNPNGLNPNVTAAPGDSGP